ncbi:hypothetical protein AVEN_59910-1 [Araneus ventricosus]|uniref:Uncharacterized protein n=1 Tax=Araneus ventricosus TaxID=182803 RepID=A0A4Y2EGU0_ARAVE|nr:hypothetical protein AVEN_59910-1 [Araneus ventricosus]
MARRVSASGPAGGGFSTRLPQRPAVCMGQMQSKSIHWCGSTKSAHFSSKLGQIKTVFLAIWLKFPNSAEPKYSDRKTSASGPKAPGSKPDSTKDEPLFLRQVHAKSDF